VERPEMGRKRKFWKVKEEFLGGSKKYLQKADMFTRFCWSFHLCSNVKFDFAAYRKQEPSSRNIFAKLVFILQS
jgi:hypothetical protein